MMEGSRVFYACQVIFQANKFVILDKIFSHSLICFNLFVGFTNNFMTIFERVSY